MILDRKLVLQRIAAVLRLPIAGFAAAAVTTLLLYLMQSLIASDRVDIVEARNINIVDFTRVRAQTEVQTRERRAKPPPTPDEPPDSPKPSLARTDTASNAWNDTFTPPDTDFNIHASLGFSADGAYLPILKVQPVYPRRALEQGLYGWVKVEFTVDEIGRVIDPVVIDHCVASGRPINETCENKPGPIFDRPALEAATRFKYKPRVVDGVAIATSGVQHLITFELDPDSY